MKDAPHLSATGMDMYLRCPLSWKMKYVDRQKGFSQETTALKQGNAVHDALEEIVAGKITEKETIDSIVFKHCNENALLSEEDRKEALDMVYYEMNFVLENQSGEEVIGTEVEFSIDINGINFVGKIDKLTKIDDKTYRVIDYKTGNYIDYEGLDFHIQLTLYAMAIYDMYPECEYVMSELHYLRRQERITYETSAKDIDTLINIASVIFEDNEYAPNIGTHCCFCDYRFICENRNKIDVMAYNLNSIPEEDLLSFYNELRAQKTLIEEKEAILKELIKNKINNSGSKSIVQGSNAASLSQNNRTFYNTEDVWDILLRHGVKKPFKYFNISTGELKKLIAKDDNIADEVDKVSFTKYGEPFIRTRTIKSKGDSNGEA